MKIHADTPEAQSITGYGPGWIGIGNEKITESVILSSRGLRIAWPCARFEDLTAEHFAHLAELAPLDAELLILGSGTRTRFAQPKWLQPLMARRIGVESMDTHAACRTFNILTGEGRHVIAALVLEAAPL